uniref:Secreted protein n=1 Tax=Arundo donax TaxID=35708 RepID=A0A0A9GCT1_ARUDO
MPRATFHLIFLTLTYSSHGVRTMMWSTGQLIELLAPVSPVDTQLLRGKTGLFLVFSACLWDSRSILRASCTACLILASCY